MRSSTTIGSVGGYVVVVVTTVPDQALGLTSCYLGQLAGAIAASHLRLGPSGYADVLGGEGWPYEDYRLD